jgi:hypothetical protein
VRNVYNHGLFGVSSTDDNPCDLFDRISFPVDEFFPPERGEFEDDDNGGCGCRG